jgi:predicted anti-sigma-YlaC factor YlaD
MDLSDEQIKELLGALQVTREKEIDCDECLASVAEFAECELAGKPLPRALEAVQFHLDNCEECQEEYRALFKLLDAMQD